MHFEGTLQQWNEKRGFGFVEAAETHERLFVHVSAFERGRIRPPLGTRLVFDVERDAQGRKRAVNVRMPGDRHAQHETESFRSGHRPAGAPRPRRARSPAWVLVAIACVLIAVGVRGVRRASVSPSPATLGQPVSPRDAFVGEPATSHRCDGRTHCSQMTSCAEATWFQQHCPGVDMDGNHDGVPCEQQWCGSR